MIATTGKTAARLSGASKKFRFLRGSWRLIMAWPVTALILGVAGWFLLLTNLNQEKQETESNVLKHVAALSRSYADHLTRTMEALDQISLHVKYEWTLSNEQLRLETIKETGLFPPRSFFSVAITDRDGKFLTSTVPNAKNFMVGNRPYFLMQKNAFQDSLYIGVTTYSQISRRYIVPFSRRLAAPDGSFAGIVLVTVVPSYFTANYDDATLGKNGFLGMVGGDRIIRATRTGSKIHPPRSPALVSLPYFASPSGSALLDGEESFTDKRSRYVGWQAVPGYPLIALTGLDEQDALSAYLAERADSIRNALWTTLALAVFTCIAVALSMLLAWRKYQLELTQATYRMATEGGHEGFYIARPIYDPKGSLADINIVDCNHRGAEFFGQRREELIGRSISTLYAGTGLDRFMGMLREALETGIYENDIDIPGDSPLKARWVHLKLVRANGELAITLRDISESKAHVEELERRGNEDALTGLPNRHWVQTYLPQAIRHAAMNRAMLALLFVDLDGFKAVNDTMGHPAGDELLRNAARRLKDAVRPHDHVVRLGGDEFLVIIENITHTIDAAHVAERALHAFRQGFRLSQGIRSIGTSIGISVFPTDGSDADTLLQNADIAMYSVKTSGKGNYRFYDPKFYEALRARLEQESELRHAIEHDQFVMYYQPRVDILTGATSSMEALVRWIHPSKGLMEPHEFIPLAEETGLILELGELVIDKVCAQLASWAPRSLTLVPVSVNVSSRQFNQADIAKIWTASLARHNIDPGLVEIELTESSMMGDSTEVSNTLTKIRRMGIKLLVDDFGTGYSSLSQLQRLDFDVLKVDRAFTSEIEKTEKGNVFFKAIITMAHALGMRVVAEGVETLEQIKILQSLHCDEIQGFYISRPLPPTETQPILPRWRFPSTA
jgi:diguanylate cyclase (GGDEF)-like protein/PAS domain S-box-containing protein